jgi:hypothetical protein
MCIIFLFGKSEKRGDMGGDSIRIYIKETRYGSVEWIYQNRDQWWAL